MKTRVEHVIGDRPCQACGGPLVTTPKRLARPDYTCLYCSRARLRSWRERNRTRAREYGRKYFSDPARRARKNAQHYAYVKANPLKQNARVRVRRALRSGRLAKGPCTVCGNPESWAHHEDYRRPLDVTWLCRSCHGKRHVQKADLCADIVAGPADPELLAMLPTTHKPRTPILKAFYGRS